MLYLSSDIHAHYKEFQKLLHAIHFDYEKDQMILLGDLLDRGKEPMKLWRFVMDHKENMLLLKGNHELFAERYLTGTLSENRWKSYGGEHTIKAIDKMDQEEKSILLAEIQNLPVWKEITTKYGKTVLTHSGIVADCYEYNADGTINVPMSIEKAHEENPFQFLISPDIHHISKQEKERFDKYIICGHVPTLHLHDSSKVYRSDYYMCIDTGSYKKEFGGCVSAYCVDTDEVFYI